jgi:type IV pilus assembly protein PilM
MPTAIGIDIGRASATAVAIRKRGGSLFLERVVRVSLDELREQGVDTEKAKDIARALAPRFLARGINPKGGNLGVSGKDAIIRYAHLPPMPPWRLALVMRYDVADVEEKTGAPLSADWRVVGSAEDAGSLVLVAMAKDERVTEWVEAFAAANLEPGSASPRPVAVGDAFRFLGDNASEGSALVLDIGRSSTEIAIVRSGGLVFARSVNQGGQVLTDRVAKHFGLDPEEAEKCKLEGRGPKGEGLSAVLEPGFEQLASIARASLDFARTQLKLPRLTVDRVVVTGGASRQEGLVEAIGETLGVPASRFDPLAGIDTSPAPERDRAEALEHGVEAAAACGLALARLMPTAVALDLLPNAVKKRREWRERTVWLYAAGAVLALYVLVAGAFAISRNSGEKARAAGLKKAKTGVDERLAAKDALAIENANRAKNLAALAARVKPSYHTSSLLAALARELPPRAAISDLELMRDKDSKDPAGPFRFEIRGTIDNAQKDALSALTTFETNLLRDADIGGAKVEAKQADGPVIEFRLVVKPKGAS